MIGFKEGMSSALNSINDKVMEAAQVACIAHKGVPMDRALAQIVADAVTAGIEELIKQQYTDEDFENDVLK